VSFVYLFEGFLLILICFLEVRNRLVERADLRNEGEGLRAVIFANHERLIVNSPPAFLDQIQLLLQFIDIVFFLGLHLFHDLLLSVEFSAQVLIIAVGSIDLILEFSVLVGQQLHLSLLGVQLDFNALDGEDRVLQKVTLFLKLHLRRTVQLHLVVKALVDLRQAVLLRLYHFLQTVDLVLQLFLCQFELAFCRRLLNLGLL